jgi:hypothetical protein
MINQLEGFSYTRIDGVGGTEFDPVAQAHINALQHTNGKLIVLEDDCLIFDYREEINVPDDADVVFLGVSTGTTHTHNPKYKKISNDIYRLYDMTSLHAVLYITEAGRQWLKDSYDMAIRDKIGFDLCTARLMPTIKVYGLNSPIWYQRDVPMQTKKTLDEALLSDEYFGGSYEDYPKPLV